MSVTSFEPAEVPPVSAAPDSARARLVEFLRSRFGQYRVGAATGYLLAKLELPAAAGDVRGLESAWLEWARSLPVGSAQWQDAQVVFDAARALRHEFDMSAHDPQAYRRYSEWQAGLLLDLLARSRRSFAVGVLRWCNDAWLLGSMPESTRVVASWWREVGPRQEP